MLRFEPARRVDAVARLTGLERADAAARIERDGIDARLDIGMADGNALARFLSRLAGQVVTLDAAWTAWLAPFAPEPAAVASLPALAARYRLGVFTNNAAAITRVFDATPFERSFFSSELGATKPDPATYAAVQQALGVEPGAIRFVDDGAANVAVGRMVGWRAVGFCAGDDLEAAARSCEVAE